MTLFTRLKTRARAWQRDESGSVAVETVLMVPLLAWAMLATLTYFDAYRNEAISYKAGLVLADAVSREANALTPEYIDGLYGLHQFLMLKDKSPDLRITSFEYDLATNAYVSVWSEARGTKPALDDAGLSGLTNRLPIMADGEQAILVETWSEYEAPYAIGLGDFGMATYNVISPRFVLHICFDDNGSLLC